MKPLEILSLLEPWRSMGADDILDSPAWAMPCRFGEEQATMRGDAPRIADPLVVLRARFGETPHVLAIAPSPRFPELFRLRDSVRGMPDAIVLALVERECAPLLQLLENAMRSQLALDGLGGERGENDFRGEVAGAVFSLTRSPQLVSAFGVLRNIDTEHASVRESFCSVKFEYASFAMDPGAEAGIVPGDAVVVPEMEAPRPFAIVEGVVEVGADGSSPRPSGDALCHVRSAAPSSARLGDVFDGKVEIPAPDGPLELVVSGKTVAVGRLGKLASQPAVFAGE